MQNKISAVTKIGTSVHVNGTSGGVTSGLFKGLGANLRHITREHVCPKTHGGDVTAYIANEYFSPSTLFASITGYTREEGFQCRDYAELLLASEAMFSMKQVSEILQNHLKWKTVLDLTGKTNIFPVWVSGAGHTILAQFVNDKWHIKDSIFGMGRGTNPGVHLLLRNEYVKVEV